MSLIGERFVYKRHFDGIPKKEDFELVREKLEPLEVFKNNSSSYLSIQL